LISNYLDLLFQKLLPFLFHFSNLPSFHWSWLTLKTRSNLSLMDKLTKILLNLELRLRFLTLLESLSIMVNLTQEFKFLLIASFLAPLMELSLILRKFKLQPIHQHLLLIEIQMEKCYKHTFQITFLIPHLKLDFWQETLWISLTFLRNT